MKIEILGSGGAVAVPRAFCDCVVCREARDNPGPPFVRHSPSLFIHDLGLLIDTPEEIRIQLIRSDISRVETLLYTHWHPDHTAGIRVFEGNYHVESLVDRRIEPRTTRVILPDRVARSFERHHALSEKLGRLEGFGLVTVEEVPTGAAIGLVGSNRLDGPDPARTEGWVVTPVALPEDIAVAYLFDGPGDSAPRRIFICMDEIGGFQTAGLGPIDLAILPCGYFLDNPVSGEAIIAHDHPVLTNEPSFEETLEIARSIGAPHTVFVHLNHGLGLRPADFTELEHRINTDPSARIEFAFDTMMITV